MYLIVSIVLLDVIVFDCILLFVTVESESEAEAIGTSYRDNLPVEGAT